MYIIMSNKTQRVLAKSDSAREIREKARLEAGADVTVYKQITMRTRQR